MSRWSDVVTVREARRIVVSGAFLSAGLFAGCDSILGSRDSAPAAVSVSGTAFDMAVGDSVRLEAVVTGPLHGRNFSPDAFPPRWESSDPDVVSVDGRGRVTARGVGTASVFVRAGERVDSASIRVGGAGAPPHRVWESVAAGEFTCALAAGGERYCWGGNPFGGHGNGIRRLHAGTYAPVSSQDSRRYRVLSIGHWHACGIAIDGAGYCWGNNSGRASYYELLPQRLRISGELRDIHSGAAHACSLLAGGERYCWGSNMMGALGIATPSRQASPLLANEALQFKAISTGADHSCGIDNEGRAYCWGSARAGELGSGVLVGMEPLPVAVAGQVRFAAIHAGGATTCALDRDGAAYCWGMNLSGTFLTRVSDSSPVPVRLDTHLRFSQLETAYGHTCGLTSAGEVYCWGANNFGQVGLPPDLSPATCGSHPDEFACSSVPQLVSDRLRFVQIAVGNHHTCGVTDVGELYCWGRNDQGQLGSGRVEPYSTGLRRVAPEFR